MNTQMNEPDPDIVLKYPQELVDGIDHVLDDFTTALLRDGADPNTARNSATTHIIALIDNSDPITPTESDAPMTDTSFPPFHELVSAAHRDARNKELRLFVTWLLIFATVFFISAIALAFMYAEANNGLPVWVALPITFTGTGTVFTAAAIAVHLWKRIQKGEM